MFEGASIPCFGAEASSSINANCLTGIHEEGSTIKHCLNCQNTHYLTLDNDVTDTFFSCAADPVTGYNKIAGDTGTYNKAKIAVKTCHTVLEPMGSPG